jgi:hypothetical protein
VPLFHTGLFSTDVPSNAFRLRCGRCYYEKKSGNFSGTPAQVRAQQEKIRQERGRPPVCSSIGEHCSFDTEVLINAPTVESARRAFNLLIAALAVSDMGVQFIPEPFEDRLIESPCPRPTPFLMSCFGLERACAMASSASAKRKVQYTLHRLTLSYRSVSPHYVDLDPAHSPKIFGVERDPLVHVYIANAIVLAYSAIEELGLEMRVPRGQSSRMPDGSWNPTVRENLEHRLRNQGIDTDEHYTWTLRGPKTRIERRKKPPVVKKARWARGGVRDVEVSLIDAIALADWMRDKVGAHALPTFARSLTTYDAHNVQNLARRLLMESLGFWWDVRELPSTRGTA